MQKLTIGLFGFGFVGQGVYQILNALEDPAISIKKIGVKVPEKRRPAPSELFSFSPEVILEDPDINLIVEATDDPTAALEITHQALKKGIPVVSANKKMIAENLQQIIEWQKEYDVPVLYEGAVCGSIPILRTLETHFLQEPIHSIRGIFNGSTNYILTQIFEEGLDFDTALKEAQEKGFAETDPTLDIGGFDPRYKLTILLAHVFGIVTAPQAISLRGIENLKKEDFAIASEEGKKIKLVAWAAITGDRVVAQVGPQIIASEDPLFNVDQEYNSVVLEGAYSGLQQLTGKGAGSFPTGAAVVADIFSIREGFRYQYRSGSATHELLSTNLLNSRKESLGQNGNIPELDDIEALIEASQETTFK